MSRHFCCLLLLCALVTGASVACDKPAPATDDAARTKNTLFETDQGQFPLQEIPFHDNLDESLTPLDGRLDESYWQSLEPIELQPFGGDKAPQSTVYAAYSSQALWLGLRFEDEHIWSTLDNDGDLWTQEVFEIFIAPQGPDNSYIEIQISPAGAVFDAHFTSHRSHLGTARAWDFEGLQSAVYVAGTLNDDSDEDRFWSAEIMLPFAGLPFSFGDEKTNDEQASDPAAQAPAPGDTWRVNLYRFDRPDDEQTIAYGWSTAPRGDFHQIDAFGAWTFGRR